MKMYKVKNIPYDDIYVGQEICFYKKILESDIEKFAHLSGDFNPIHMDDYYASNTVFHGRIAHGMLIGAFISAVLSNSIPGPGGIYISQSFEFLSAAKIDDCLCFKIVVIEKIPINKMKVNIEVINQHQETLVIGEALFYISDKPIEFEMDMFEFSRIPII